MNTSTTWATTWSPPFTTSVENPLSNISRYWDISLAVVCFSCFLLGTFGNICSVIYFCNKRKDLPTKIYILMSGTDALTSLSVLPVAISFMKNRDPGLFEISGIVCMGWTMLWAVTSYFSVFLVLILSIVRTVVLLSPFTRSSHRVTMSCVGIYLAYLLLKIVIPYAMKIGYYTYTFRTAYCEEKIDAKPSLFPYYVYRLVANEVQLAVPVLPIIISCVVSCYCVLKSRSKSKVQRQHYASLRSTTKPSPKRSIAGVVAKVRKRKLLKQKSGGLDRQKQATITILLVTGTYIVCNIPVFLFYILFLIDFLHHTSILHNNFAKFYGWNIVYVICVALNAAANPIIYFCRIQKMRAFYSRERVGNATTWVWGLVTMAGKKEVFSRKESSVTISENV